MADMLVQNATPNDISFSIPGATPATVVVPASGSIVVPAAWWTAFVATYFDNYAYTTGQLFAIPTAL